MFKNRHDEIKYELTGANGVPFFKQHGKQNRDSANDIFLFWLSVSTVKLSTSCKEILHM